MKLITESDQLEVGRMYWTQDKEFKLRSYMFECDEDLGHKYLGPNKMWATAHNPQAFKRWYIYGPIEMPTPPNWTDLLELPPVEVESEKQT